MNKEYYQKNKEKWAGINDKQNERARLAREAK